MKGYSIQSKDLKETNPTIILVDGKEWILYDEHKQRLERITDMEFTAFKKFLEEKNKKYRGHCSDYILGVYDSYKENNTQIDEHSFNKIRENNGGLNSYEINLLFYLVSDIYLIEIIKKFMGQENAYNETGEYYLNASYQDCLNRKLFHILLRRFEEKIENVLIEEKSNEN